jgi:hypothetical protein
MNLKSELETQFRYPILRSTGKTTSTRVSRIKTISIVTVFKSTSLQEDGKGEDDHVIYNHGEGSYVKDRGGSGMAGGHDVITGAVDLQHGSKYSKNTLKKEVFVQVTARHCNV